MQALGTETSRPSSAAQCVASVAVAELPVTQWSQCIPTLVNKVVADNTTERSRESALEAIGKPMIFAKIKKKCVKPEF